MSNWDDWLEKAEIDYFSKFIPLWLAFNGWYREHYYDVEPKKDRAFIDKIKDDFTPRNNLFFSFQDLMTERHTKKGLNVSITRVVYGFSRTHQEEINFLLFAVLQIQFGTRTAPRRKSPQLDLCKVL